MSIPSSMRAWSLAAYGEGGSPIQAIESLTIQDVVVPQPNPGQVLLRVKYASVNPIDWKLMTGKAHALLPVSFPYTPGFDVSGVVVGANACTRLAVGDEVCSDIGLVESCKQDAEWGPCGAFAEYCVVPEDLCSKKTSLSFAEAAAVPLAALTAYEALFTGGFTKGPLGNIGQGSKVMVLGGSSAVGAYAIQLAVWAGAIVYTTASSNTRPDGTRKIDYCAKLGAIVFNYKEKEWHKQFAAKDLDLVFDCIGQNDDWVNAPNALKAGGLFISIANKTPEPQEHLGLKCTNFLIEPKMPDLDAVISLIAQGKIRVPIDSEMSFSELPQALMKSFRGESAGKIVIKIESMHLKLDSMQAFQTDGNGSVEAITLTAPSPGPHEIVVKNNAISLNPVDTKQRSGFAGELPLKGKVLGWDSCGIVVACGSSAKRFQEGDRVWFAGDLMKPGTNAEYTAVDERIVSFAPRTVSDADAAALPLVGLTAFEGLTEQLGLSAPQCLGKSILVLPGAGGVGSIAIQLAKKMLHMKVIATSSRPDTTAYCKRMGADHVINHRELLKPQLERLGLGGVDYIFNAYDTYAYMEQYTDIINPCGGIVSIAECVGHQVNMMQMPMFLKRVRFAWELMFQRTLNGQPEDYIKQGVILQQLAHLVETGVIESTKTQVMALSLEGLKQAHKHQDSKTAIGKTVLMW